MQKIFFKIVKIINFRGDLTDNSAKQEALVLLPFGHPECILFLLRKTQ